MAGGEVRGQAGSRVAVASGGELNIAALAIFTSADVVASSGSTVSWASGDIRYLRELVATGWAKRGGGGLE